MLKSSVQYPSRLGMHHRAAAITLRLARSLSMHGSKRLRCLRKPWEAHHLGSVAEDSAKQTKAPASNQLGAFVFLGYSQAYTLRGYNVNAEQKLLFDQLTQLQQRVAINVLAGMSQRAAYYAAGGTAATDDTADVMASRMIRDDRVKTFMDAMKAEAVSNAVMSRQEALEKLSNLARTDLKDLVEFGEYELGNDAEGNPIVQASWRIKDSAMQDPNKMAAISELTAGKEGIKIKTHSPVTAIQQLAKMQGWESAKKFELAGKDGGPIQVQNIDELTDEQLATIAAGGADDSE